MMKRKLAIFGAAAALVLGAVGVTGVARAATPKAPVATQQAQGAPYYGPGWGMMGGYLAAPGSTGVNGQAPSQAWQAMWASCEQFMDSWAARGTPPATPPATGK